MTNQIIFTHKVSQAIKSGDITKLESLYNRIMENLESLTGLIRGKLSNAERITAKALMVLTVHNRDIMSLLIQSKTMQLTDFEWSSQLRYYLEDGHCKIRTVNASFDYGYEYLGTSSRLVVSPLTERCYRTLTNALHMNLGGACIGPSSTGKTETVRDLAKAQGKPCVVFNCSAEMNYKSLANFFKGLASTGKIF